MGAQVHVLIFHKAVCRGYSNDCAAICLNLQYNECGYKEWHQLVGRLFRYLRWTKDTLNSLHQHIVSVHGCRDCAVEAAEGRANWQRNRQCTSGCNHAQIDHWFGVQRTMAKQCIFVDPSQIPDDPDALPDTLTSEDYLLQEGVMFEKQENWDDTLLEKLRDAGHPVKAPNGKHWQKLLDREGVGQEWVTCGGRREDTYSRPP